MARAGDVTELLIELGRGDDGAMDRLIPLVYDELRHLAHQHRWHWRRDERAPGTTSLVHEAYVKLVDGTRIHWKSRGQFFRIASSAMRSILVDNARYHSRLKRGGERVRVPLEDARLVSEDRTEELLVVDEALERLQAEDERLARIVECRLFGGLTVEETAEALDVSPATVKRGWNLARALLYRDLGEEQ